jgi:membrane-bound serine protease (ClpP class)
MNRLLKTTHLKAPFFKLALLCLVAAWFFTTAASQSEETTEQLTAPGAVYLIHVEGLIDNGLHKYLQRGLTLAERSEASGVVLYIDTFGGLVDAADEIRKNLLDFNLPVISFIDKNAASAGALIAIATDSIYMAPGASIGAATVVDGSGQYAAEKMQSYMRGLMRSTAEATGRDPRIAEAMVDESIEVEGVVEAGKLLTLSTDEAVSLGLANGKFSTLDQVLIEMSWQDKELVDLQEHWAESVLRFLANPVVSSILMLMMLGGLYFELQSPGVGFPGLVSGIGAMLFFAPLYIMGLAQSWEIVLFFIGVILIVVEVFVIPGFGVAGLVGISLVILSMATSLIGNVGLSFPELHQISQAIWTMAITLILGIAMIASMIRYMPQNRLFSKLILADSTDREHGYTASSSKDDLIGLEGVAITSLRPSGTVLIDERRIDVISAGEFIEKGARVKVIDTTSSRVVVDRIE